MMVSQPVADRRRRVYRLAARDALGMPSVVLGASYIGFGSLVRESGLSVWLGLFSTLSGWALPGQIALVELYSVGASLIAISVAVGMTNARLMPMVITLMPLLRDRAVPRWRYYLYSHLVAVTAWAVAMRRCPELPAAERLPYFLGFALTLWAVTLVATAVGFFLAGWVPEPVKLGLVFLNPIYFMLVFASDVRLRARVIALLLGAVLGPSIHRVAPDWSLLLSGLIGGTLAWGLDRWLRSRHV